MLECIAFSVYLNTYYSCGMNWRGSVHRKASLTIFPFISTKFLDFAQRQPLILHADLGYKNRAMGHIIQALCFLQDICLTWFLGKWLPDSPVQLPRSGEAFQAEHPLGKRHRCEPQPMWKLLGLQCLSSLRQVLTSTSKGTGASAPACRAAAVALQGTVDSMGSNEFKAHPFLVQSAE